MTDQPGTKVADLCAQCGRKLAVAFVCPACRRIDESRVPDDWFDLLGAPAAFDQDIADLRRRFLAISRLIHPDQFGAADPAAAEAAVRVSARLNDAFEALSQPARRAAYLLERAGGLGSDQDRSVPPEVLMDTMSLRERIEQASTSADQPAIKALTDEVKQKRSLRLEDVSRLARTLTDGERSEAAKSELRQALNALKYYDNLADLLWSAQNDE